MPGQCFQTRRDHQFQIPFGEDGIGIFPVKNFALLGDANLAGKTSGRLREDGGMRGPAATANGSTATMEEQITYTKKATASGSLDGISFTDATVILSMTNNTTNVTTAHRATSRMWEQQR